MFPRRGTGSIPGQERRPCIPCGATPSTPQKNPATEDPKAAPGPHPSCPPALGMEKRLEAAKERACPTRGLPVSALFLARLP